MVGSSKVIEELIAISLLGMVYIAAFAPLLSDAIANYTGGGTVGATLGVVVGYLPMENFESNEIRFRV